MKETFRRAHDHNGAAFVEIYQNCNVFNDGAFEKITGKDVRADKLIPLVHGEPIRFGAEQQHGVVMEPDGRLRVVEVADVGRGRPARPRRAPGRARARLPAQPAGPRVPTSPRPSACSAPSSAPSTATAMTRQLLEANERRGPGRPRLPPRPRAGPGPSRAEPGRREAVTWPTGRLRMQVPGPIPAAQPRPARRRYLHGHSEPRAGGTWLRGP